MYLAGRKAFSAISIISAILGLTAGSSRAQNASSTPPMDEQQLNRQIAMMRKDIRSQKKQIIAANLKLTDKEAEKFWPAYDRYTAELVEINNMKYALYKQYAQNFDNLTDDQLDKSVKDWLGLDQSVAQLRVKYVPIFRGILSAKNTALFFQLDRRVLNMIDLQLASIIPLVEP
jgi:hypothetical protein